jgi:Na+/melibiose symporter-like transporter
MQEKHSDNFIFAVHLCFAFFVIVLLAITLVAAEVYLANGHVLADIENANGGPLDRIAGAMALPE